MGKQLLEVKFDFQGDEQTLTLCCLKGTVKSEGKPIASGWKLVEPNEAVLLFKAFSTIYYSPNLHGNPYGWFLTGKATLNGEKTGRTYCLIVNVVGDFYVLDLPPNSQGEYRADQIITKLVDPTDTKLTR